MSEGLLQAIAVHALWTAGRVVISLAAAFAAALPLGILTGCSPTVKRLFSPLMWMLYTVPKVSLFPLAILLFGLNDFTRILVVSLVVFFQAFIAVSDAAASVPKGYLLSMQSLGAGRLQVIRFLYLPAVMPAVFTALRVGTAAALAVLFFTEATATRGNGLGRFVIERWSMIDYQGMAAGTAAAALLGIVFFILIDRTESMLPYRK